MATEGYSALSAFDSKIRLMGMSNNIFDTTALVEAEIEMLKMQIAPKERQKAVYTEERGAWQSFKTNFGSISKLLNEIKDYNPNSKDITYSRENVIGVTASAGAADGNYSVSVTQMAKRHQVAGTDMGSSDTALGIDDTVSINGTDLTITNDMTLRDIVNQINGNPYGASATIISNRLVINSSETGAGNNIALGDGVNNAFETLGVLNADDTFANELQASQDAEYTVNGIALTNSTNVVSDAIDGVTIDLKNVSTEEINFSISEDKEATSDMISKFVKGYNDAIMHINKHTEKGSYLQGQTIPISVRREMGSTPYYNSPSGGKLYEVGIEIDGDMKNGSLRLNETKLKEMLESDPQAVKEMFFGEGGIANFLKEKLDPYTKESGSINSKIDGLSASIEDLTDTIDKFDRTFELQRESLLKKYSQFETMMAQLNSQQMYMEAQLKSMNWNED